MKIAITGGAGFIGSVLAERLKGEGHELVLIDLKKSDLYPEDSMVVDIRNAQDLANACAGADAIYHLAAEHRDDVTPLSLYTDVNVTGGQNVIEAAKANAINKIIFTSSVAVYPLVPADPEKGSSEIHAPAPFNPYGQSKWDSEKTFQSWADEDPARSLGVIRLVATFGPGNRGNVFTLMNQVAGGKFIMIGDGRNRKSIAYVGNVAAFLHHALGFKSGTHLYNYADKPDLNMRDFVASIRSALGYDGLGPQMPYALGMLGGSVFDVAAKLTGKKFPISTIRIKKFCANTIVNTDKLSETGFTAPYSLRDGLQEMIKREFQAQKKAA
ncbi:MAG: NAD-dependent epimerase/dehydratase family protein [Rhodospirillales bacterium]|nr:NAD-dependent epimerase/dehydratase family protein [Rhodospirillales bacterium]